MTSAWFWVHISTTVYLKSHLSSPKHQVVAPLENGSGSSSCWPVETGHCASIIVVTPAFHRPLLLFFSSCWAKFHSSALESQSRDFHDVGASWARSGLDALGWRVTRGWRRPPLWGPVETVSIGSQSRGCREADDSRCDSATFAVDPVIGLKVEVWTTGEGKSWDTMNNVHLLGLCNTLKLQVIWTSCWVMPEICLYV